ncbi:hypothetical protein UlMin_006742 [Ulmus minor]
MSMTNLPDLYEYVEVAHDLDNWCLVWSKGIVDLRVLQFGGEDIFLHLANSELDYKKEIIIGLISAISIGAALFGVIVYGLHRWRARKKRKETTFQFPEKDGPSELHFFDLDSILIATNNFSRTNKLGQGGFGSVYKVIGFFIEEKLKNIVLTKRFKLVNNL